MYAAPHFALSLSFLTLVKGTGFNLFVRTTFICFTFDMEFLSVVNFVRVDIQRHIHTIVRVLLHTHTHIGIAINWQGETRKQSGKQHNFTTTAIILLGICQQDRQRTASKVLQKLKLSQDFSTIFQQLYFNFLLAIFFFLHSKIDM